MPTRGLGKGMDALVPVSVNISQVAAGMQERVHRLALDVVVPNQNQPRRLFDDMALEELAQSIKEHGILQPIIVTRHEQNKYSIIAGERRWRAARRAGLNEIPAIIRRVTDHQKLELALLENVQRSDLTAIEQALTVHKLHTEFSQSYEDISRRLGKAYTTIINIVRLLGLPPEMQESLQIGTISEGHARALLSLQKFPKDQKTLFASIVSKKWNVRQAEQFVVAVKRGLKEPVANSKAAPPEKIVYNLKKYFGTKKISLQHSHKGSGKFVINYTSEEELNSIVEQILGQQKS